LISTLRRDRDFCSGFSIVGNLRIDVEEKNGIGKPG